MADHNGALPLSEIVSIVDGEPNLAITEEAFNRFFTLQFVQQALQFNGVHFLVYDTQEEKIVLWQK